MSRELEKVALAWVREYGSHQPHCVYFDAYYAAGLSNPECRCGLDRLLKDSDKDAKSPVAWLSPERPDGLYNLNYGEQMIVPGLDYGSSCQMR